MSTKTPISSREAAEMLGVTPRTVVRLVERNEIPGFKVGDVWRFYREDSSNISIRSMRGRPFEKDEEKQ